MAAKESVAAKMKTMIAAKFDNKMYLGHMGHGAKNLWPVPVATVEVNQTAATNCSSPNLCCSLNLDGEIGGLPFIYIFFFCLSSLVSVALTPFHGNPATVKCVSW
jgi:hypothetical protein